MTDRKPGILTIAYYFDPAGPIGGLRPWRFHQYLRQFGYENPVVAALGSPASTDEVVFLVPDVAGSFWEKRAADREAGRPTERMPLDCHGERILRKTVLPGQHALAWSRAAVQSAEAVVRSHEGTSVVFSTYPPLGTHLAGFHVARTFKMRWIADFRDPIAIGESLSAFGKLGIGTTEKMVFRNADAVIANTELAARSWREKFPWAEHKIHVIWNGYDPEHELTALPVPERPYRHIVHVGNLYGHRNGNIILSALMRMRQRGDTAAAKVRILLAGPSDETSGLDENLHRTAAAEGWLWANGRTIPREEAQQITREADGLLLLQPQSTVQVPAKLYEYLSIGRPILALAPRDSSIEWILSRAGVPFVCVFSDDPPEVVDQKLAEYLTMPSTPVRANDWFHTTFNAKRLTSQLATIVDQLSEQPTPAS